jgi:hypothetical protein
MHFTARNKNCSSSKQMIHLFIYFSILNFTGCCIYSFTGSSVPEHLNSIAIPISDDRSGSGEPGLRELLTERLTQRFIEDNSLQVTERTKADAVIECTILSLPDAPVVVTAGEQVDTRRVTVSVHAVYRDLVKRKTVYERTFSEYGDYNSSAGDVNTARRAAIEAAVDKITEDILLDTVSGW